MPPLPFRPGRLSHTSRLSIRFRQWHFHYWLYCRVSAAMASFMVPGCTREREYVTRNKNQNLCRHYIYNEYSAWIPMTCCYVWETCSTDTGFGVLLGDTWRHMVTDCCSASGNSVHRSSSTHLSGLPSFDLAASKCNLRPSWCRKRCNNARDFGNTTTEGTYIGTASGTPPYRSRSTNMCAANRSSRI